MLRQVVLALAAGLFGDAPARDAPRSLSDPPATQQPPVAHRQVSHQTSSFLSHPRPRGSIPGVLSVSGLAGLTRSGPRHRGAGDTVLTFATTPPCWSQQYFVTSIESERLPIDVCGSSLKRER